MNVSTRDLVPFHSFKKPKFDWIEVERDDDSLKNTIPTATTTAPTYQIYTPSINYYVGVYLMIIGKHQICTLCLSSDWLITLAFRIAIVAME